MHAESGFRSDREHLHPIPIKAIIWDCDDTLVQGTNDLWFASAREAGARFGVEVPFEYFGVSKLSHKVAALVRESGVNVDSETVRNLYYEYMRRFMDAGLQPMPGAVELVKSLSPYFKMGVASSSPTWYLEEVARVLGVSAEFKTLVGGERVEKGKPDPEILLLTAKELGGFKPRECLVFEDAISGVQAANAAQMRCIIANPTAPQDSFPPHDLFFRSLEEVSLNTILQLP